MQQENGPFPRDESCCNRLILLVEDDHSNAQLFMHIFSQETFYRVLWAMNGFAALKFTRFVKPQLFLLDYSLPDMNGIVLYDRLHARKELEDVPAIIVGACLKAAGDDIKQRELLALEKPFNLDEFLVTIENILAKSSEEQRL
ncbi:MAG: response regulator [Ktedonobacteraceae bacterium]